MYFFYEPRTRLLNPARCGNLTLLWIPSLAKPVSLEQMQRIVHKKIELVVVCSHQYEPVAGLVTNLSFQRACPPGLSFKLIDTHERETIYLVLLSRCSAAIAKEYILYWDTFKAIVRMFF